MGQVQRPMMTLSNFPRYWPFMRGIHRSPVDCHHKGQWRGALMFSLICSWTNGWANNRDAGDLRRHHAYYDVTLNTSSTHLSPWWMPSLFGYGFVQSYKTWQSKTFADVKANTDQLINFGDIYINTIRLIAEKFPLWRMLENTLVYNNNRPVSAPCH